MDLRKIIIGRGWPNPEAMAAAAVAHAAVLAWLALHPAVPVPKDESSALTVRLLPPPSEPAPSEEPDAAPPPEAALPAEAAPPEETARPREAAPADEPSEIVAPPAEKPKKPGKPSSQRAPARREHRRQKPEEDKSPSAYANEGAQEVAERTAVYSVSVGAGGIVESVTLARSSGAARFDAAGVSMIRNAMTFDPPPPGSASVAMIVTINFSPDAR
jgi:TonB family protein